MVVSIYKTSLTKVKAKFRALKTDKNEKRRERKRTTFILSESDPYFENSTNASHKSPK